MFQDLMATWSPRIDIKLNSPEHGMPLDCKRNPHEKCINTHRDEGVCDNFPFRPTDGYKGQGHTGP